MPKSEGSNLISVPLTLNPGAGTELHLRHTAVGHYYNAVIEPPAFFYGHRIRANVY